MTWYCDWAYRKKIEVVEVELKDLILKDFILNFQVFKRCTRVNKTLIKTVFQFDEFRVEMNCIEL